MGGPRELWLLCKLSKGLDGPRPLIPIPQGPAKLALLQHDAPSVPEAGAALTSTEADG